MAAGMLCVCLLAGCGGTTAASDLYEPMPPLPQEEWCEIEITAGEETLYGILYDNQTARDFAAMLPLTVDLWHPAPDFARAFDLPKEIPQYENEAPGMAYELGSLAYWQPGPSIALIYKASREQTVVPVVPIGKVTSDVSFFETYAEEITVTLRTEGEDPT